MEEYIGKICPFCNTAIKEGEEVKLCPKCETPQHAACWEKNNGCAAPNCHGQKDEQANKCRKCGATLADGQKFCVHCGTPVEANKKFFCVKCGAELREGQAFCTKCGQRVGAPINAQAAANKPHVAPTTSGTSSGNGPALVFKDVQGAQKTLNVYNDHISLTQIKNFRTIMTHDWFKGTKEIYFADMSSVQYRAPTSLILGYIQFETANISSNNNFASENSWTFDKSKNDIAQKILEFVQNKVAEAKRGKNSVVMAQSAADELLKFKQLLDSGIITQEEFDNKKKQLLGL